MKAPQLTFLLLILVGLLIAANQHGIENIYGVIEHTIDEDENPICYEEAELVCLTKLIEIVEGIESQK